MHTLGQIVKPTLIFLGGSSFALIIAGALLGRMSGKYAISLVGKITAELMRALGFFILVYYYIKGVGLTTPVDNMTIISFAVCMIELATAFVSMILLAIEPLFYDNGHMELIKQLLRLSVPCGVNSAKSAEESGRNRVLCSPDDYRSLT